MKPQLQVLLVGEQPTPNLLSLRHVAAEKNVLVCTDRTRVQAEHIQKLLASEVDIAITQVEPYRPSSAREAILQTGDAMERQDVVVNLTGGTKLMMLGAFLAAQIRGWLCAYLESERRRTRLYLWRPAGGDLQEQPVQDVGSAVTIDEYLKVHSLWGYVARGAKYPFEKMVVTALEGHVCELKSGIDWKWTFALPDRLITSDPSASSSFYAA